MASKALLESQSKRIETLLSAASKNMSLLKDPQALKSCLTAERDRLLQEVERLKTSVIVAEIRNGKRQLYSSFLNSTRVEPAQVAQPAAPVPPVAAPKPAADASPKAPKEKKPKAAAGSKADAPPPVAEVIDVSRLDMRIGLIEQAGKHPDADNLYVEQVNVGEDKLRTVVSGLAKHIPIDAMQKRLGIFLCNLKPAKLKGIASEAMIMCANKDGTVEIIDPPAGSKPGDRVVVVGFPGQPDAELNPKKKIWEQVMPDLRTDDSGKAAYKGALWTVNGDNCVCKLSDAQIK